MLQPEPSKGYENFNTPPPAPLNVPDIEINETPKGLWTPVSGTPEVTNITKKTLSPEKEKDTSEMSFDELSSHLAEKKKFIDRNTPMNFFNNTIGYETKALAPGEIDYGLSQGVAMTDMLNIDAVNSKLFAEKENFFGQATAGIYKGVLKGAAGVAEGITYLADFDSHLSEDPTMDNAIASKIREFKTHLDGYGTGSAPIHTRGGGAMDIGDSAWWANQLESAVTSSVQFGALGLAGGLTLGLAVRSSLGALGASKFAAEKLGTLAVAAAMNKIESTQMAVEMIDNIQKDLINQGLSPVEARKRAEEAASDFVLSNKAMMLLDFGQLNTIFSPDKLLKSSIVKSKAKDVIAKASRNQKLATYGKMAGMEAVEEVLGDANQAAWEAETKSQGKVSKLSGALDFITSEQAGASAIGGVFGGTLSTVTGKAAKKISGINKPIADPLFLLGDMPEVASHPGEIVTSDPGEFQTRTPRKKIVAEEFSQWKDAKTEEERDIYRRQAEILNINADNEAKAESELDKNNKPYQDPLKTISEESGNEFYFKRDNNGKDVLFKKEGDVETVATVEDKKRLKQLESYAKKYSKEDKARYEEHLSKKEQAVKDKEEYEAQIKAHEETSAAAREWMGKFKEYENKVKTHEDYYETISANDTQRVLTESFERYAKLRDDIEYNKDNPKKLADVFRENILGLVQRAYDNTGLDVLIAKLDIAKDATGQGAPSQEVKDMIAEILPTIKKGGSFYEKYNSDTKLYGKKAASKLIYIDDRIKRSKDNLKEAEDNLIKVKNETVAYASSLQLNPTDNMVAELKAEIDELSKANEEAGKHALDSGVDNTKLREGIMERAKALTAKLLALHPNKVTKEEATQTIEINEAVRDAIVAKTDALVATMALEHYSQYYKDPKTIAKKNEATYNALKTAIINTDEPAVIDNLNDSVEDLSSFGQVGMNLKQVSELRKLIKDKKDAILKKEQLAKELDADIQNVKTAAEESNDVTKSADPIQDLEDQEELNRLKEETDKLPEDKDGLFSDVMSSIKSAWSSLGSKISALSDSVLNEVNKYNPFITTSLENNALKPSDIPMSSVEDADDVDIILNDQTANNIIKTETAKKRGRPKGSVNKKKKTNVPVLPVTPALPVIKVDHVKIGGAFEIEEQEEEDIEEEVENESSVTTVAVTKVDPNVTKQKEHDALAKSLVSNGDHWKVNTIKSHIEGVSDDEVASFMNNPANMLPGTPVSLTIDMDQLEKDFKNVQVTKGGSSRIISLLNNKSMRPSDKYDTILSLMFKNENPVTIPIIGNANGQRFSMNIDDSMNMVKAVLWAQCHNQPYNTKVLNKSTGNFTIADDYSQYVETEGRSLYIMGDQYTTLGGAVIDTTLTTIRGVMYENVVTANGETRLVALTVARVGKENAEAIVQLVNHMNKLKSEKFKTMIEETDDLPFYGMTTGDALNLLVYNGQISVDNDNKYPFALNFKDKTITLNNDGKAEVIKFNDSKSIDKLVSILTDYPRPVEYALLDGDMTTTGVWFGEELPSSYNEHIIRNMGVTSNIIDNDGIMFTSPVVTLAHKEDAAHKNHVAVTAELVKLSAQHADIIRNMIANKDIKVVECS